jgi:hypothetical protein
MRELFVGLLVGLVAVLGYFGQRCAEMFLPTPGVWRVRLKETQGKWLAMRRGMTTVALVVVGLIGLQLPAAASCTWPRRW